MESRYRECFLEDVRPIKRFADAILKNADGLRGSKHPEGHNTPYLIKALISRVVHDDIAQVMGVMSKSLDQIELSLHDDNKLRDSVGMWRDWLGRWRNMIFHQERALRLMRTYLTNDRYQKAVNQELASLEGELREGRLRIDNVFQSLMSAMSIVESHKAIQQAEGVSKLTQLAFFFIPLSLVATVFGMNVTVRQAHDNGTTASHAKLQADRH